MRHLLQIPSPRGEHRNVNCQQFQNELEFLGLNLLKSYSQSLDLEEFQRQSDLLKQDLLLNRQIQSALNLDRQYRFVLLYSCRIKNIPPYLSLNVTPD